MKCSRLLYFFVLVLSASPGCEDSGGSGPQENPPATASVDIGNVFFRSARNASTNPAVDTVAVGGTVTWTWTQAGTHGVRFDDPAIPSVPEEAEAGSQHSVTFPAAGTYTYECSVHGSVMSGRIVVR
jgi:plastocyanin